MVLTRVADDRGIDPSTASRWMDLQEFIFYACSVLLTLQGSGYQEEADQ
jgi:hypothetical protein